MLEIGELVKKLRPLSKNQNLAGANATNAAPVANSRQAVAIGESDMSGPSLDKPSASGSGGGSGSGIHEGASMLSIGSTEVVLLVVGVIESVL